VNGSWIWSPPIASYCTGGKIPKNTWVSCQVPFSAFGASSSTVIHGFSFDENVGKSWSAVTFSKIQLLNTVPNGTGGATSTGGSSSVSGGSSAVGGSTSATSTVAGGASSLGGSSANGGTSTIGGSSTLGGSESFGGSTTVSGGASSLGGSSATVGGSASEGGSVSAGGTSSAGGLSEIGGTTSIGGMTSSGRSVSVGGASSIGGSGSTGGGTSFGCSISGQQTGEFHLSVKDGAGVDRDFLVIVPASYLPGIPRSLLFGFHGVGGTYDIRGIMVSWKCRTR